MSGDTSKVRRLYYGQRGYIVVSCNSLSFMFVNVVNVQYGSWLYIVFGSEAGVNCHGPTVFSDDMLTRCNMIYSYVKDDWRFSLQLTANVSCRRPKN
jgi:hypothetical protein